jgi:hypothetical protein
MKVNKTLAGMEDLLCVPGKVTQNRGGTEVEVQGLDIHLAVNSTYELALVDPTKYPRVRVYSSTADYVEYAYNATSTAGIPSGVATGCWLQSNNTQIQDGIADLQDAISTASNVPLGDGKYSTGNKTFTAYNQYLVHNGIQYKPTTVPYTTNIVTYPDAADDIVNLRPFNSLISLSVATIADLQNCVTVQGVSFASALVEGMTVKLTDSVRRGDFTARLAAAYSAEIAADTLMGIYVPITGTDYVWVSESKDIYMTSCGLSEGDILPNGILALYLKTHHVIIDCDVVVTGLASCVGTDYNGLRLSFENSARVLPDPTTTRTSFINISGFDGGVSYLLTADALAGSNSIESTSLSLVVTAGEYIYIKSDDFVDGGDSVNNKRGQIFRVTEISGDLIYFDGLLTYDMLLTSNAYCTLVTMVEDVELNGVRLNKLDFEALSSIGINLKYVDGANISHPIICAGKQPLEDETAGAVTYEGINAISVTSCLNILITKPLITQIGWYGVGISGACRNIRVNDIVGYDCRHTVSVVWSLNGHGEPIDIMIDNGKSTKSRLSGFDTHATGKNITFRDCDSKYSQADSGFQIRNNSCKLVRPVAYYNNFDGIIARENGVSLVIIDPTCNFNARNGVNTLGGSVISGGVVTYNGASDIVTNGGCVSGTTISKHNVNSNYPIRVYATGTLNDIGQTDLVLDGIKVVRSSDSLIGGSFIQGESGVDFEKISVINSYLPDFVQNIQTTMYYSVTATGNAPITENNILFSDKSKRRGRVNLVAGSVIVTGIFNGARFTAPYYAPKIRVRKIGNAQAYDASLGVKWVSYSSFKIISNNASDTDLIEWSICD